MITTNVATVFQHGYSYRFAFNQILLVEKHFFTKNFVNYRSCDKTTLFELRIKLSKEADGR